MTQSVVFVEALQRKCTLMGWNQGTKQITSFVNKDSKTVDIIKQYGPGKPMLNPEPNKIIQ